MKEFVEKSMASLKDMKPEEAAEAMMMLKKAMADYLGDIANKWFADCKEIDARAGKLQDFVKSNLS